jgi:hypothetical protein
MKYRYTSRWSLIPDAEQATAVSAGALTDLRFRLSAVFIAGEDGSIAARFRDAAEQEEWEEATNGQRASTFSKEHALSANAADWLETLSRTGNGLTEEYDEVRELNAASRSEALEVVWKRTVEAHGGEEISLYRETVRSVANDRTDPLDEELTTVLHAAPPLRR